MNLSKKSNLLIALLFLGLLAAFLIYEYAYQDHKTIEDQKIEFSGSADDFKSMIAESNDEKQNVIVELSGKLTTLSSESAMMNNNIFCQFKDPAISSGLKKGQNVSLKGRFIGYDELLEEIKLDQCIIIKP